MWFDGAMLGTRLLLVAFLVAGCVRRGPPAVVLPPAMPGTSPHSPAAVEVAVTVDDLPAHGPLLPGADRVHLAQRFIEVFQTHHLPPVFGFVNGIRAAEEPASQRVLSVWTKAGNHLGNHTYSHVSLDAVALPAYFADLERGEAILDVEEPTWRSLKVFRYPFLFEGNTSEKREGVRRYLSAHGYAVAEVSVEADDWAFNRPFVRCAQQGNRSALDKLQRRFIEVHVAELESMVRLTRALAGHDVRQILLLHLGTADADALDKLLTSYEQAGVRWISLPDALADPFYALDPGVPFPFGAAFPYLVAKSRGVAAPPPIYNRGLEEELAQLCR